MKKNKGFTLVELLAVIAILAILVIIALPNVMGMFNDAKKSSFTTELKNVYKVAQQQWMMDSMTSTGDQVYSRCKTCTGKSLNLSGRSELDYYIKIDKSGKVVEYYATDGTYQFSYSGDLLATQINDIEEVAKLGERDVLKVDNNTAYTGDGPSPVSFATDSWATIQKAIKNNNTSVYSVGDTKTIDMGSFGTHTVRIANKSTPSECNNTGFSQTACGFVIEFADIITTHRMNPFEHNGDVNGDGNRGGWEYSEIRQYVNNDIYNALPSDLKSIIIDTYAVSGYGAKDSANFTTTDKLYYLSKVEVDNQVYSNYPDSSYSRQLDIYSNFTTDKTAVLKMKGNQKYLWCFRTAAKMSRAPQYYDIFYGIRPSDGNVETYGGCNGVSPAFRIG